MARLPGLPSPAPYATQLSEEEIEGNDYDRQNGRLNRQLDCPMILLPIQIKII